MVKRNIKGMLSALLRIPEENLRSVKETLAIMLRHSFFMPPISFRNQFPFLLNFLNLKGRGAEIGVRKGDFSECILRDSNLSLLFSIDPWKEFDRNIYQDIANVSQEEYDKMYEIVLNRFKKYGSRSSVIRKASFEASGLFEPGTLDFIYIDANHSYEACKLDLEVWWPKLKKKGIFAGHDYLDGLLPTGRYGVKRAVDEFVNNQRQRLYITKEELYKTWYLIKE